MNISKKDLEKLVEAWTEYRDENFIELTNKNKKHTLKFDTYADNILRNVPKTNKKYVKRQLDNMADNFFIYTDYWIEKYYKAGFFDCLNFVIMSLDGKEIKFK